MILRVFWSPLEVRDDSSEKNELAPGTWPGAVATPAWKARKAFGRHEFMLRVHGVVHGQGGGARPIDHTGSNPIDPDLPSNRWSPEGALLGASSIALHPHPA